MTMCLLGINELRNFFYPRSKRQSFHFMLNHTVYCYVRYRYVGISIHLTSFLRYKFLVLDTYHPDTLIVYLSEQGCEDLWLF